MGRRVRDHRRLNQFARGIDLHVVLVAVKGLRIFLVQRATRFFDSKSGHRPFNPPSSCLPWARLSPPGCSSVWDLDERGIDDVPVSQQETAPSERLVEPGEESVDDAGSAEFLAEAPERIRVGHSIGEPEATQCGKLKWVAHGNSTCSSETSWRGWTTKSLKRTFGCQAVRPSGATTGFDSAFSMGGTKKSQSATGSNRCKMSPHRLFA